MSDTPSIPQPVVETDQDRLPIALTFFLSQGQRAQAVRVLRDLDTDRTRALMLAVSILLSAHKSHQQDS